MLVFLAPFKLFVCKIVFEPSMLQNEANIWISDFFGGCAAWLYKLNHRLICDHVRSTCFMVGIGSPFSKSSVTVMFSLLSFATLCSVLLFHHVWELEPSVLHPPFNNHLSVTSLDLPSPVGEPAWQAALQLTDAESWALHYPIKPMVLKVKLPISESVSHCLCSLRTVVLDESGYDKCYLILTGAPVEWPLGFLWGIESIWRVYEELSSTLTRVYLDQGSALTRAFTLLGVSLDLWSTLSRVSQERSSTPLRVLSTRCHTVLDHIPVA